ncbi:MAG: hypothetical protein H7068_07555 [Pedobacter sp.]|nr:hypothetical protein [Chitinophagaceae bacterium]
MNIVKQIPAYLLAIVFFVFGLNFFFPFMPKQPTPTGDAGTFIGVIYSTGLLKIVKILEIVFAILITIKPTRALGLLLIAPIVINIFLYEVVIAHQPGIGVALVAINALAIYLAKEKYLPIIR